MAWGVATLALLVAACGGSEQTTTPESESPSPSVATFSFTGTLDAAGGTSQSGITGQPCASLDYPDVRAGVPVTVRDANGQQVGLGRLDEGRFLKPSDGSQPRCVFPFVVIGVTDGASLYEVEVGSRGGSTYSREELLEGISLRLG
jgi:hypothetical protein